MRCGRARARARRTPPVAPRRTASTPTPSAVGERDAVEAGRRPRTRSRRRAACCVSSAGVPSAASRPPAMIATRSQRCSASSIAVRREHHGRAACREVAHELPRRRPRVRVHARGRLVEEHDLGLADERARERQPLRLPAREPPHRRALAVAQPDDVEQRARATRDRRSTRRTGAAARAAAGPGYSPPSCSITPIRGRSCAPSRCRIEAEHAHRAGVRACGSPRGSRPSWSCPRRSGRAARTPRRARR